VEVLLLSNVFYSKTYITEKGFYTGILWNKEELLKQHNLNANESMVKLIAIE
jgi:hypothetical protein